MHNKISYLFASAAEAVQEKPSGMLFASWSIIIVLAAMVFVFLRYGKKEYSIAVLPLFITPLIYIFSGILARAATRFIFYPVQDLRIIITITAGLISCLLLGPASRKLEGARIRKAFFLCCSAFLIILTVVFVVNILNVSKI
ncbi:MAG TPA: hypothetical protein GXX54_04440 [Clostridiales bacterium]|nr:hypothetical protein [Clostridiales bacterium]